MLIETLQAILRAASHTLDVTCNWKVTEEELTPLDERDFTFCLSTLFHQRTGPVQSILLGCDRGLAEHVASLLFPSSSESSRGKEDKRDEGSAFRAMCSVFQQTLAREAQWYVPTYEFCQFGPGTLRVHSSGTRSFHLHLPTPAGSLHVIVNSTSTLRAQTVAENTTPISLTGDDVQAIMHQLVASEADVQLECRTPRNRIALHNAVVAGEGTMAEEPVLVVSSGCLANRRSRPEPGTECSVYLSHEGQLLQFRSTVAGYTQIPVGARAALPLLAIRRPDRLANGQRRQALRVVPSEELAAEVGSCRLAGEGGILETEGSVPCIVRDLSFLGVRLAAPWDAFISRFVEGSLVLCRIQLPDPWGPTKIAGIARRIRSSSTDRGAGEDQLGIEFLSAPSQRIFEAALESVRQYVLAEQETGEHNRAA